MLRGIQTGGRMLPALLGLAGVAWVLGLAACMGFDGLYGQDSYTYVTYGRELRAWMLGGPHPENIFWPEGYPLLGALLSFLTGDLLLPCRLISAVSVGLAMYWLGRLARLLSFSDGATTMACIGLGSAPFLLRNGMMCMSDAMAMALVMGLLRFTWGYRKGEGKWSMVWAMGLAALAVTTRYAAAVLVLPLLAALLWRGIQKRDFPGFLLGGLSAGFFIAVHLYVQGFQGGGHHFLDAWTPANFFRSSFLMQDGSFDFPLPNALFNLGLFYHPGFLGFSLLLLPFFLLLLFRKHRPKALFIFPLLLYLLFLSGIPFQNPRFLLLALPFLWALLLPAADFAFQNLRRHKVLALAAVVLVLGVNTGLGWKATKKFADMGKVEKEMADAVGVKAMGHVLEVQVFTLGMESALAYYLPNISVHSMFTEEVPPPRKGDLALFKIEAYAGQFQGQAPMKLWESFNIHHKLEEVAAFEGGWTLHEFEQ